MASTSLLTTSTLYTGVVPEHEGAPEKKPSGGSLPHAPARGTRYGGGTPPQGRRALGTDGPAPRPVDAEDTAAP